MNTSAWFTRDLYRRIRRAVAAGDAVVHLPGGRHEIDPALLPQVFCHVSNNDHGLKRILCDLDGASDLILDGSGCELVFLGPAIPVRVSNARGVQVRNLTIDWQRPAFTQGVVSDSDNGMLQFTFDSERYPLRVQSGRLVAHDERGWQTTDLWNALPFTDAGEVATPHENWHLSYTHQAEVIDHSQVRLRAAFPEVYQPGTTVVLMHGKREAPGIWIADSAQVMIEDCTLHHALGMGVVAQTSRDVIIQRVRVAPSGERYFSTWVDATHHVDCQGHTQLLDCNLRGQFDDASNIHNSFSRVIATKTTNEALLQLVHPQQFGPSPAQPGQTIGWYDRQTLTLLDTTTVTYCEHLNEEWSRITVPDTIPDQCEVVCSLYDPRGKVTVRGNAFGANRGRGILINVEQEAVVEDNHMHVSGIAVESVPDANYWWEGTPLTRLTVRNNIFDRCGWGPCGADTIHMEPELPDGSDPRRGALRDTTDARAAVSRAALGKVTISNNTVRQPQGAFVHAAGIEDLSVTGNRLEEGEGVIRSVDADDCRLGPGIGHVVFDAP